MKINNVGWQLFICLSLIIPVIGFVSILFVRIISHLIVYFNNDIFNFGINDVLFSIKAGLGGGIPLAIGIWLISKKEEIQRKKQASKSTLPLDN